jgi:hypothetical protein
VTDAGVRKLEDHPALSELYLSKTRVSDATLDALAGMKTLSVLRLYRTNVSDDAIEAAQKRKPSLRIEAPFRRRPLPFARSRTP